ncbi:DUF4247 domain-containing protein [Streptomyces chromofuscus]|uniref:DUF4247 domain-containing protein n=1 Tax=Streptomyces chromofuscus TaxID=42881 RepID=A0A7M2TAA9_STRCW|nr:DUF4247 domain-containing protein [Streptomyces chromofuscus]QOV45069.1 DUF4247 domain-containing protein [Streptomyces chromofuscus]GGT27933.1 lipoprotein [Streptomyces chromofuscus]
MKTARRIGVLFLTTAALAACSGDSGGNAVPSGWIRQEYRAGGGSYLDRSDPVTTVASEIEKHTAPQDRTSSGRMVFLRYRDDIVAVSPYLGGSRIEIDDYRGGYHRWRPHLSSVWPDPDSDSFRGGGPGSGK